jgi:hypothetical protein
MKKFTTILAVALFGAVLGFACGGSTPAAVEPTPETTNPCTPETTDGDDMANPCSADDMGGDTYGGDSYGM